MPEEASVVAETPAFATRAGFTAAVRPLLPVLRARARRLTSDAGDRDDLVQDTLIRAWRFRSAFRSGTNLKAWLMRIERNAFLSGRRRWASMTSLDPATADTLLVGAATQEDGLHLADLDRAVASLTVDLAAAFTMSQRGLSHHEASGLLGISVAAFKSRLFRARAAIVRFLESEKSDVRERDGSPGADHQRTGSERYREWKRAGTRTIG